MALMAKTTTKCHLWYNKHHGLAKCDYALHAGFACTHNLTKAATLLVAFKLKPRG